MQILFGPVTALPGAGLGFARGVSLGYQTLDSEEGSQSQSPTCELFGPPGTLDLLRGRLGLRYDAESKACLLFVGSAAECIKRLRSELPHLELLDIDSDDTLMRLALGK